MSAYVQPGQRVLLKANLLRAANPDEMVSTHPAVVAAVVRLVQEAGGIPVIGDSPGGLFTSVTLRAVYQRTGMMQVAEQTGAELNWDVGQTRLPHPEGRLIKSLEVGTFCTAADVIISLPKLKTHSFMQFTGATKNLFGVIPGTVKVGYHAKLPRQEQFGEMLIDILTLLRPALTVMDGIVGMQGNGPSAGSPFPVGVVLSSADSVELDVVATALVGIDAHRVYPLRAAMRRGLTTGLVSDVELVGDPFSERVAEGFVAPQTSSALERVPAFLRSLLTRVLVSAPLVIDRCIGCGICAQNCPVEAIEIAAKRAIIDLETCIRCYCCHEVCPERAIDLHKSWLGRLLS